MISEYRYGKGMPEARQRGWDGGYSGNPTLWPMIQSGVSRDLIVVQLVPDAAAEAPKEALAIRRRIGEIVSNSNLVAEMQAIGAMRSLVATGEGASSVHDLRCIESGRRRASCSRTARPSNARAWIERLHGTGRLATHQFVARHGADIGVRETLDVGKGFVEVEPARDPDQVLGKLGIDTPIARLVGVGQRAPGHGFPKAQVIELDQLRAQAGCDVAQALAIGKLREHHAPELIGATELADSMIATVTLDDTADGLPRKMIHQLGEHQLADVHARPCA